MILVRGVCLLSVPQSCARFLRDLLACLNSLYLYNLWA